MCRMDEHGTYESLLLSGHARFPSEAAAKPSQDILTITVEVSLPDWIVERVAVSLATDVARDFVARKLTGTSLLQSPEDLVDNLERTYHARAKRTVIAAVRDLFRSAMELRNSVNS